MKILIWHNNRGAVAAFAVPPGRKRQTPASYFAPGGPWPKPWRDLEAKGPKVTWDDWADHLTRQAPYHGWWSVEEIPDAWQDQPGFLRRALAQAQRRGSIL